MRNRNIVMFERDNPQGWQIDKNVVIQRLRELYLNIREANSGGGSEASKFDLNFLFADVLSCLDLLNYADLTQVIGVINTTRIWTDVSQTGK